MKKITRVTSAVSRSGRCEPRYHKPTFAPSSRRFSTAFRYAQRNRSDNSSSNEGDTTAPEDGNRFSTTRIGGWDGSHLPKAMPKGWKEKMAPFLPPVAEGEEDEGEDDDDRKPDFDFETSPLTEEQEELAKYLRSYEAVRDERAAMDPNFRQYVKETEDFDGGDEPDYPKDGFWAMDEEKDDVGVDEEWANDDITSQGHAELEQHRELREFARVTVWDMPLLWNHRKEFKPPTAAQVLRFRYSTYMGEVHPASRKVVVDFTPSALPDLTPVQVSKLIKLLGVRYNPSKDQAKMSCERFPTPAQNKRYLGDLIDKLIAEAKDSTDTFEDVPFDFRHHRPRSTLEFPQEWKITPQRQQLLDDKRKAVAEAEIEAAEKGKIVQGAILVEMKTLSSRSTRTPERQRQQEPVMIPARQRRS